MANNTKNTTKTEETKVETPVEETVKNEVAETPAEEKKGLIAKGKEFGEKHPKIVKVGKIGLGIVAVGAAFLTGKAVGKKTALPEVIDVVAEEIPEAAESIVEETV